MPAIDAVAKAVRPFVREDGMAHPSCSAPPLEHRLFQAVSPSKALKSMPQEVPLLTDVLAADRAQANVLPAPVEIGVAAITGHAQGEARGEASVRADRVIFARYGVA